MNFFESSFFNDQKYGQISTIKVTNLLTVVYKAKLSSSFHERKCKNRHKKSSN